MYKRLFGEVASFDAFPSPTSGGGGGWWWSPLEPPQGGFIVASKNYKRKQTGPLEDPRNWDSYEILKVKSAGPQTCPFPPF